MHDAIGRPLKVGDRVLIPCVIAQLQATETYCNVTVRSAIGRRPDGNPETVSAINTGVLLRANASDENNIAAWATNDGLWPQPIPQP